MVLPVFPKGIVPWTDRVDLKNIVFANDPNTLAAEIGAIEATFGAMPQVETAPPVGIPVTYSTVGARIHDVQVGTQRPVCTVSNSSFTVSNADPTGSFNFYNVLYDPFGWYNGNDIGIAADGWYVVTANQKVDWWSSGYMHYSLFINDDEVTADHWSWNFPENGNGGRWKGRDHVMSMTWQGIIHSGQRVRAKTENGTGKSNIQVTASTLRVSYARQAPHSQQG